MKIREFLDTLSTEDKKKFARLAWDEAKDEELMAAASVCKVGREVFFVGRKNQIVKGVIVKTNQKTVKVKADTGVMWNVSKQLIKAKGS